MQSLLSGIHSPVRMSWCTCVILSILLSTVCCSRARELPTDFDDSRIGSEKGALHIVTNTQCMGGYLTYQIWAQKYSFEMVNQPGKFTQIISCDYPGVITKEDLSYMDTMYVPDWANNPVNGDYYAPYNRPVALIYWLADRRPTAEWTLILDPDMYFRQPFLLKDFEVPEGYAMAARYDYMIGVSNKLADIHIPHISPRQDEYGGPIGRRADMAGPFYLIRTKDLMKVAPLWLKYTENIREDSRTMQYTRGTDFALGEREWMSDMYGYTFATTTLGIWHKLVSANTQYWDIPPVDIPAIVHYGQLNSTIVDKYNFDKHDHVNFDQTKCPPWNMSFHRAEKDDGGLFPHPPFPDVIPDLPPREKYAKLLLIEVVATLNRALCARHRRQCPPSAQLEKECGRVDAIAAALKVEFDKLHVPGVICHDNSEECKQMAENGDCETRWMYMSEHCRASCNLCRTYIPKHNELSGSGNVIQEKKTEDLNGGVQPQVNKVADSSEVLRCQQLRLNSFLADPKCRRLYKEGAFSQDWPKIDKISFRRRKEKFVDSGINSVYRVVIFAVSLVCLAFLFRGQFLFFRHKTLPRRE